MLPRASQHPRSALTAALPSRGEAIGDYAVRYRRRDAATTLPWHTDTNLVKED